MSCEQYTLELRHEKVLPGRLVPISEPFVMRLRVDSLYHPPIPSDVLSEMIDQFKEEVLKIVEQEAEEL